MSTTSDTTPVVECTYPDCDAVGRKWEFHHGKYCSNECETRHAGYEALAKIRFDHCLCTTCFRKLKTINPPKPDFEFLANGHGWTLNDHGEPTLEFYSQEETRCAAVGFQYLTQFATKGEKNRRASDHVVTGTICDHCGNTDHTHHDPILATRAAIGRLADRLVGVDDLVVDVEVLHREYDQHQDLDLAVGRARQDDDDD